MTGPSVIALNRFLASSSRARERSARMIRVSSADQDRLELTLMRASFLRVMSRTALRPASHTRSLITGSAPAVPGWSWRNASRDPRCDHAAWRMSARSGRIGALTPVPVSTTNSRTADGATYVGSP